ncbi:MAG: pentapeptide repeat-containing protein [Planctomycetota bacterium]
MRSALERGARGTIAVRGDQGAGKTTSLEHLAAVLGDDDRVALLERPRRRKKPPKKQLVVHTGPRPASWKDVPVLLTVHVAAWTDDDLIEYTLATHREACRSILDRVLSDQRRGELGGAPVVCRRVLDAMADEPELSTCRDALYAQLAAACPRERDRLRLAAACLSTLLDPQRPAPTAKSALVTRLLHVRGVQLRLAAELIADRLEHDVADAVLDKPLTVELIRETAETLRRLPDAEARLQRVYDSPHRSAHPTAAGLMLALDPAWRPPSRRRQFLGAAHLRGAAWPGVELIAAQMMRVNLSGANLRSANLSASNLAMARLRGADLTEARLDDGRLDHASCGGAIFRGADLSRASLLGAMIEDADLRGARLDGAVLDGLRLRVAAFEGASFRGASLSGCDLEHVAWPGAAMESARLPGALLTGAALPAADLRDANLSTTGLADVNLERADLRGANFRHASFHMGSSRSGLVDSPIACEGSRTGYYTDESLEQSFRAPEEIRKANLRGADLRGAELLEVDLYLVDLRGAKLDPHQLAHARRCRAILSG